MAKYKDEMYEDFNKDIENLMRLRDQVVRLIPEGLPHVFSGHGSDNGVFFSAPYSSKCYDEVVRELVKAGWVIDKQEERKDIGSLEVTFIHPDLPFKHVHNWSGIGPLRVFFEPDVEGATCTRRKIGEYQTRVYEIVCNEGK